MWPISNLTDITLEQRSRQRRFPHIGMRHQAEIDGMTITTHFNSRLLEQGGKVDANLMRVFTGQVANQIWDLLFFQERFPEPFPLLHTLA